MTKVLIATTSKGKTEKFKKILSALSIDFLTLNDLNQKLDIEEIGETFAENAILKAASWSNVVNNVTLATDGGIIIPSLGKNWNGLLTHRFAGKKATARDKIDALLSMMRPFEKEEERKAYWQETLAVAQEGKLLATWDSPPGEGLIPKSYDPKDIWEEWWLAAIWYCPEYKRVYSKLTPEEMKTIDQNWSYFGEKLKEFLVK